MKSNHKKIQASRVLKSALVLTLLVVATGCSGGGGGVGPSLSSDISPLDGNTSVPTVVQTNLKMDLCDEVNGWENDCRFLGMKYINLNPEEIIPLTEQHGRGRGRGRGGSEA